MTDFDGDVRDLGPVPEPLLAGLERKIDEEPGLWLLADRVKPNRFGAFEGTTLHIVFQFPLDLRSHLRSGYAPFWSEWRDVVEPVVRHATRSYGYAGGRTARIMLARLLPGQRIGRHVDGSPSAAVPHKIHVPLQTGPEVLFFVEDRAYHLTRGRAWEVNNRRHHEVHNESDHDRVHLIFDYFDGGEEAG
jgi:hypothetical protein